MIGFLSEPTVQISQYLSGLASMSESKDQVVVKDFLVNMGSSYEARDAMEYLKFVQKMKGEWYNQQGRTITHLNHLLHCFSFPDDPSEIWKMLLDQIARREARRAGSKRKGQRVLENVYFKSDLFFTIVKIQLIDDFERGHLSAMNNQQELHYLKF